MQIFYVGAGVGVCARGQQTDSLAPVMMVEIEEAILSSELPHPCCLVVTAGRVVFTQRVMGVQWAAPAHPAGIQHFAAVRTKTSGNVSTWKTSSAAQLLYGPALLHVHIIPCFSFKTHGFSSPSASMFTMQCSVLQGC